MNGWVPYLLRTRTGSVRLQCIAGPLRLRAASELKQEHRYRLERVGIDTESIIVVIVR